VEKKNFRKFSGINNPFFGMNHSDESKQKMSINQKWQDCDFNYCKFSEKQQEIFDGLMLSDGHLESSRTSARISCGFKFKQTLECLKDEFSNLHFSNPWKSKEECY
jgi:hypothetical protein